jgi:hypothetical protein
MYKYLGQGEPASSLNLVGLVAHFAHQAFYNRNKHSALKLYNVCSESGSEKLFTGLYTEKSKLNHWFSSVLWIRGAGPDPGQT